ncbi:MAG: leucyl/phenylalanyl-tRNA--protein transferase [Pseudomonadota bacterium]
MVEVTPDLLLRAYAAGYFPMAESARSETLLWVDPPRRGVLPLEGLHVSRSLRRRVRQGRYCVTINKSFDTVIRACAESTPNRPDTWINNDILMLYGALHRRGHAHSVECWDGDDFAGGLYGVSLGGAFFGESMISRQTDASKVALVHLVAQLRADGFVLLDTQFKTDHLASLGCIEIEKPEYEQQLDAALEIRPSFSAGDRLMELGDLLQSA